MGGRAAVGEVQQWQRNSVGSLYASVRVPGVPVRLSGELLSFSCPPSPTFSRHSAEKEARMRGKGVGAQGCSRACRG